MPNLPDSIRFALQTIVLYARCQGGFKDLDGFSHIIDIYHFHYAKGWKKHIIPFMDDQERGIFATRSPQPH